VVGIKKGIYKVCKTSSDKYQYECFFAEAWLTNLFEGMWQLTKSVHIKEYKSAFANIPAIVVSAARH